MEHYMQPALSSLSTSSPSTNSFPSSLPPKKENNKTFKLALEAFKELRVDADLNKSPLIQNVRPIDSPTSPTPFNVTKYPAAPSPVSPSPVSPSPVVSPAPVSPSPVSPRRSPEVEPGCGYSWSELGCGY